MTSAVSSMWPIRAALGCLKIVALIRDLALRKE